MPPWFEWFRSIGHIQAATYVALLSGGVAGTAIGMVFAANVALELQRDVRTLSFAPRASANYQPDTGVRGSVLGLLFDASGGFVLRVTDLQADQAFPSLKVGVIQSAQQDRAAVEAALSSAMGSQRGGFGYSNETINFLSDTGIVPVLGSPPGSAGSASGQQPGRTSSRLPSVDGSRGVVALSFVDSGPQPTPTLPPTPLPGAPTPTSTPSLTPSPGVPTVTILPSPGSLTPGPGQPTVGAETPTPVAGTPSPAVAPTPGADVPTVEATAEATVAPTVEAPPAAPTSAPLLSPTPAPRSAAPTEGPPTPAPPTLAPVQPTLRPTNTPVPPPTSVPEPTSAPAPPPTPVPVVSISLPVGGDTIFNVPDMQPGDDAVGDVVIANNGSAEFTYTFTVAATSSSLLDTDPVNGLQLTVLRCGSSYGPSCTQTVYNGPAIVTNAPMGGPQTVGTGRLLRGLRPATSDYLEIRFSLPTTGDNSFQRQSTTLQFTWSATQAP